MITKAISLFFLSAVKFALAPASGLALGFGLWQTILITTTGGVCGILFFYLLSDYFVRSSLERRAVKIQKALEAGKPNPVKFFSRKNRLIVKVKQKFGVLGIAAVTPAIISIPVGSILAARFFRHNKLTLVYLALSVFLWSLCLSLLLTIFF
ncbi:MAG: hypothetical protein ACXITV_01820 [Luteibaculaceae bacterium]